MLKTDMLYNSIYFVICIVTISKQVISSSREDVIPADYERKLRKIYLFNKTISKHQQSKWFVQEQFPALENFNIDFNNTRSAIQNTENERLESTLLKAFKGESVKIVVYGGSNTAAGLFPILLQQWWDKNITPVSGSVLKVKNIAIGGTSSTYFPFCYDIYLDANEVVDLFILELSVNDAVGNLQNSSIPRNLPLEQFTRQLLNRPNRPGVFFVNLYTLIGEPAQCTNLMDFDQNLIIDHYNTTAINLRNLVCSFKLGKYYATVKTYDLKDAGGTMHLNPKGHAQTALLIVQVFMRMLKKLIHNVKMLKNSVQSYVTPFTSVGTLSNTITTPQCWASLTPNYKSELRSTLQLKNIKSNGFVNVQGIRIKTSSYSSKEERKDSYGGLSAREKGSVVTILFTVVARHPHILRSVGVISRFSTSGGEVDVWLDNHYSKRTNIKLHVNAQQTAVRIIGTQVTPGNHTLTMHVVKKGISVLVGAVVGPPDGPC
jgi:hypothetical protein